MVLQFLFIRDLRLNTGGSGDTIDVVMSTSHSGLPERADFAIITVLPEELEAIQQILGLKQPIVDANGRIYHCAKVASPYSEQGYFAVCARCSERGNIPASQLAADILRHWDPLFLLVVGIAGGIKGREELALGDVVISGTNPAYYQLVKEIDGEEKEIEMPVKDVSERLLAAEELIRIEKISWWQWIRVARPDQTVTVPKVHRGQILTGETLLSDPKSARLERLLNRHYKALAVEMESGGVARALHEKPDYRVQFLVVRGISDYCNEERSQETRDAWRVYAAQAAAAVALAIIQNTRMPAVTRPLTEQYEYRKAFETALQGFPEPPVRFELTFSFGAEKGIPIKSLLDITEKHKRVILRGRAGSGKSMILGTLARALINRDTVPILLNLKNWKKEYSSKLTSLEEPYDKLDVLLRVSITDLNLRMLSALSTKFIFVDGLNEVYGEDAVREILNTLDEYVRREAPRAYVLVTDRLTPRGFLGSSWVVAELDALDSTEARKRIESKFGKRIYDNLPENDKELLEIAYFLDSALKSDTPRLGSKASSIRSFFTSQIRVEESTLDHVAQLAFNMYKKYQSSSFDAEEFKKEIGEETWAKLLGVINEPVKGMTQFDHQLKHDYLASRHLAKNEDLWEPSSFDAVSFESNSFDSLSMVLEQLVDPIQGDRFLKRVYDWNWLATVTCMANATRAPERRYTVEMEVAVIALVAEKLSDPVRKTRNRAERRLGEFPEGTIAHDFLATGNSLEKVLDVVRRIDSDVDWFVKWKTLFTRYRDPPLNEKEIHTINEKDPILGWTASNVIKRFELNNADLRQLRAYFDSFVDDASKNTVRWRVVHALGAFDTYENVELLFRALDSNKYLWESFGAARSLVEISARTKSEDRRRLIFEDLRRRAKSMKPTVLEEIGHAVFYRGAPDTWSGVVIPTLQSAMEAQKAQADRERWKRIIEDFNAFCAEGRLE